MQEQRESSLIQQRYNAVAEDYADQYEPGLLRDLTRPYPANYLRLERMLSRWSMKHRTAVDIVWRPRLLSRSLRSDSDRT